MHIAVHCITNLKSLEAVVRAVKKANPNLRHFKVTTEIFDRFYRDLKGRPTSYAQPGVYIDDVQIYTRGDEGPTG